MIDNLLQFNKEIDDFAKTIPNEVTTLQKKIVLEALKRVVLKTPVDTGRARGNWQVAIGRPAGTKLQTTDKSGSETINKGLAALAGLPDYDVVFIDNNLEYIEFLEAGSSQQAPVGMLAITVEELRQMFE